MQLNLNYQHYHYITAFYSFQLANLPKDIQKNIRDLFAKFDHKSNGILLEEMKHLAIKRRKSTC